jgi:hypothetical protein
VSDLGFLLAGCDGPERIARLRELRVLVSLYCGWDHPTKLAFDQAVAEPASMALAETALTMIDCLPALIRRRLLSSYGALMTAEPFE